MTIYQPTPKFYEQDFQLWIAQTIHQLQTEDYKSLDIEHLVEELVDLGKSEKNALESNLMILLAYLFKLAIQSDAPDMMKNSWYQFIIEHRERVLKALDDTPSLSSYLPTVVEPAYSRGRKIAIKEGKIASFGVRIPKESHPVHRLLKARGFRGDSSPRLYAPSVPADDPNSTGEYPHSCPFSVEQILDEDFFGV